MIDSVLLILSLNNNKHQVIHHQSVLPLDNVSLLSTIILFSGLVPLRVVDLFDSFFLHVGPVDSLGVVVGNIGELGGLGNGVLVLVDKFDKLVSLFICYLNVLAYHNLCFFRFENLISKPVYCF